MDYALTPTTSLSVSYLFVHGDQLSRSTDINIGASSPLTFTVAGTGEQLAHYRFATGPFVNFARIIAFQSSAVSTYNGLTVEANRRFTAGLQLARPTPWGRSTTPCLTPLQSSHGIGRREVRVEPGGLRCRSHSR